MGWDGERGREEERIVTRTRAVQKYTIAYRLIIMFFEQINIGVYSSSTPTLVLI